MKNFFIVIFIIFTFNGCNTKRKKEDKPPVKNNLTRLYDLYYIDILNKGKSPIVKNFDSLNEIKRIKNHFIWLKESTGIDSLEIKEINMEQKKIAISDTIKAILRDNIANDLNKYGVTHSFSKPYSFSKDRRRLIFWESDFQKISHTIGVTFYSREVNNLFSLDSSLTLYNSSIR
jgi:hypothetical protein